MRHVFTLLIAALFVFGTPAEAQKAATQKGITYAQSGMKLDLCRPQGERRKTGVIFIHGGGFSSGKRDAMFGYCKLLAQGGFPSVTVSYRLTSAGHAFPAALQDVSSAVAWMRRNARNLGIDPNKIVLVGYSAGGTLAMSTGLARNSNIAGVVSVAGISDFAAVRTTTPHRKLRRDIDAYLGGASSKTASPISQVSRGDPPVLLFHGTKDKFVPVSESVRMAQALNANRVKVLLKTFEGGGHGIMLPFSRHLKPLLQDLTRFLVAIDAS